MMWKDTYKLAQALEENYPDEDIEHLSLVDIADLILALSDFEDDPATVNEQSLQVTKEEWINIREKN